MFYISAAHGLLYEFAIALHDAIFIPDQTDKYHHCGPDMVVILTI